jgi:hypothetical protein
LGNPAEDRRVTYVPETEPGAVFVITACELIGKPWRRTSGAEGRNINEPEQVSRRMG